MDDEMNVDDTAAARSSPLNTSNDGRPLLPGTALCLSGGGYRAMLFHVGALWRLHEAGQLKSLVRISSVSGGSITAGMLAQVWNRLQFDAAKPEADFIPLFVEPIRNLAGRTLDAYSVLGGIFLPGSIGEHVAAAYRKHLFGDATLQDLPDAPRFVINATSVQTGVLWRFSKPYMGDYRVGRIMNPTLSLATAVAASSAFPPVLSPITIEVDPKSFTPHPTADLQTAPYNHTVVLADGGVYDNLGLETVWKRVETVLVSDAGAKLAPEPEPYADWPRHAYRVLGVIDSQVRALRKRQIMAAFDSGERKGTYWGIGTEIAAYGQGVRIPCDPNRTLELAQVATRLARIEPALQERLINWGYAITDAALRRRIDPNLKNPVGLPYPGSGI
jgi:NTE family protein